MPSNLQHLVFVIFLIFTLFGSSSCKVSLSIDSLNLTVKNEFFEMKFIDGIGSELRVNGGPNIAKKIFIDFTSTHDSDEDSQLFDHFQPTILEVISQSDDLVHFVFKNEANRTLLLEMHCIVDSSISGMYQYVVIRNNSTQTISEDEIRMRFNMQSGIMNAINNGKIQLIPPTVAECNLTVQDATFLLSDGTYYSKYDLADYVREANYYGVLGNGYGTWIIHADHEYFSGGPLKQDLITHQYGYIFVYLTGAHFGTPHLHMASGFEKMYGPWLVYFTQGTDEEMVKDVERQMRGEVPKWPYSFINDTRYPVSRGTVTGTVKGVKAMVVLSPPNEDFDLQVQGYSYYNETVNGAFELYNVRPGYYKLSVYPLKGASVGTLLEKNFTVSANKITDAGTFEIKEPSDIIWQIGEVDHRASEFKYSKEKRNYGWHLHPPANLTFDIGTSVAENDWFYAQTKNGTWKIQFEDVINGKGRDLLISVAGATYSTIVMENTPVLNVYLNYKFLTALDSYGNDKSIYRGALQSGNYHHATIHVDAELVENGTNTVSLELVQGMIMYDCLVYISS